jgi:ubiquinone/menaquinone biosynthesis C-methylase UbiE
MHRLRALHSGLRASLARSFAEVTEKVPATENIRKGWDLYAQQYANLLESRTFSAQAGMMSELSPKPTDSILEMACGSGYFSTFQALRKPQTQKYKMVDLSPNMVNLAKIRVYNSLKTGRFIEDVSKFVGKKDNNDMNAFLAKENIDISVGDCENLSDIHANSYDVVIGGLFLHLVSSPEKVVRESHRVLKKGGRAGFSVFGCKERSLYFTLFDLVVAKRGHVDFRSKFHLGDETKLTNLLKKEGFKNIRLMRMDQSFTIRDEKEADEHFTSPANQATLKKFKPEVIEEMKKELRAEYKEYIGKQFIGIESLIVVGEK